MNENNGDQPKVGQPKEEQPSGDGNATWVVNATPASFETDVLAASHEGPVVVDFWAPWCAPCRALAPILENLAREFEGRFTLVKANTDELPDQAGRFGVQGIPAVYGVVDGEVVDGFSGALPEPQIRPWLEQIIAVGVLTEARRLEESAPAAAEAKYRAIIASQPDHSAAMIGLARVLLLQQNYDECQQVIDQLEKRGYLEPEAEKIKATLDLQRLDGDKLGEHREAAAAAPDDLNLQFQLAESLAGASQYEETLKICLDLVSKDREGIGDRARQLMIEVFRVLPEGSELTSTYRRKLSMALY